MAAGKVRVPQADGEVVLTTGDNPEGRTFRVADHLITPASNAERDALLTLVDGARAATKADEPKDPAGSGSGGAKPGGKPGTTDAGSPGA